MNEQALTLFTTVSTAATLRGEAIDQSWGRSWFPSVIHSLNLYEAPSPAGLCSGVDAGITSRLGP